MVFRQKNKAASVGELEKAALAQKLCFNRGNHGKSNNLCPILSNWAQLHKEEI